MTEMRRFQFWENFYMPLRRIRDRSARAELALKILEAAFEDEPPEFDDMEGLVADTIVPLILKDVGGKGPGRPRKGAAEKHAEGVENRAGKGRGNVSKNVSENVSENPFKAKLSASASAHRAAAACAAQRAEGAGQAGPGWERTGSRCRKCRRHLLKAPNGTMACPGCEPELTGSPAPGFAEAGAA